MNQETAISISNVTKSYRLFNAPLDRLKEAIHPLGHKYHHKHLALDNITFDIPKGSTLGILGRNGAGKSTLLELITGVLEPTSGHIEVNGKISALLELGAGFNPELTGRENLLANAPLRGMTRADMEQRIPEIEDFADIGEYIDQPVKTYSSGMFVRLAFSMSVCVDPEIMIIDEALSVGDARFQEKCFRRLNEFKDAGKTFIIVSHAAEMIATLCDQAIVLEQGKIDFRGGPREGLIHYGKLLFGQSADAGRDMRTLTMQEGRDVSVSNLSDVSFLSEFKTQDVGNDGCPDRAGYNRDEARSGDRRAEIVDYMVVSDDAIDVENIEIGKQTNLYIKAKFHETVEAPRVSMSLHTPQGQLIYGTNTEMQGLSVPKIMAGQTKIFCFRFINTIGLGSYMVSIWLADIHLSGARRLDVRESIFVLNSYGNTKFNGAIDIQSSISLIE